MSAQVEQNGLGLALALAAQRFFDGAAHGVVASGAGTMPSARAKVTPASKHWFCV